MLTVQKRWMTIAGWILTGLIGLGLTFSAVMKFQYPPEMAEQWVGRLGFSESLARPIGILELACVAFFMVPRTAVLGAVLLTGYLGGAIVTHVRIGDDFVSPVIGGVLVWLALFLRDPRVRALLPIRTPHGA